MKPWLYATILACIIGSQATAFTGEKLTFSTTEHAAERALVVSSDKSFHQYVDKKLMKESDLGIALYDLDGDGKPEILVYSSASISCGSIGCAFIVYKKDGDRLRRLLTINTFEDITVSDHATHGMKDLVLKNGQGQALAWRFDGQAYGFGQ